VVAIRNPDADAFVARPDPRRPIILVFGPDQGLVRERVDALLRGAGSDTNDPFSVVAIDGDTLASDPGRLADEARTLGLFGGRRLVHVRAGARSFNDALENLLSDPPKDALIVIEAGDLKRGAPLRKIVEASPAGAAVPCYQDNERDVARLISSTMSDAGVAIDAAARDALLSLLGSDRMATRSELDKLILHAGEKKRVDYDDVRAVIADSSALVLDDVVDAAAAGEGEAALIAFAKAREAGIPASVMIGAAIRHIALLHRLSLRVGRGEQPGRIVEDPALRIHFSRKDRVRRALDRFSADALERTLAALGVAALAARRTAEIAEPVAERELLALVKGARRR